MPDDGSSYPVEAFTMRPVLLLLPVLCVLALLGSDSPREYDNRTEYTGLDGTWQMVDAAIVLTCRGSTWKFNTGGRDSWRGTQRIDITREPHHLDLYYENGPYQGKTLKCIYKIDGDTLTIAGYSAEKRPTGFQEAMILISKYKRIE
jgi:uncharacterized protein (TIGR03067 family)